MANMNTLAGVLITPLKKISHPKGEVMHALKATDDSFVAFGEAYFSSVIYGETKGWKKHTKMTLNIIVPTGTIQFCLYDDRQEEDSFQKSQTITLSLENYCRLTIPPGVWVAFRGLDQKNFLLNIASIEHDPTEAINLPIDAMAFIEA